MVYVFNMGLCRTVSEIICDIFKGTQIFLITPVLNAHIEGVTAGILQPYLDHKIRMISIPGGEKSLTISCQ